MLQIPQSQQFAENHRQDAIAQPRSRPDVDDVATANEHRGRGIENEEPCRKNDAVPYGLMVPTRFFDKQE